MKKLLLKTGIITFLFVTIFTSCREDELEIEKSISLNKTEVSLAEGEEISLIATVNPEVAATSLVWSSSNTEVATVDDKGKVTAVKLGEAVITVATKEDNKTAKCKVTVGYKTVEVVVDFEKENSTGGTDVKFIIGDTEANRTVTIKNGTAPYLLIQKDCSSWLDHKSTVNVPYTKSVTVKCSKWDNGTEMNAGDITGNTITFDGSEAVYGEDYIIRDAAGKEKEISVNIVKQIEVSETAYTVLVGQTINNQSEIKVEGFAERIRVKSNSNPSVVEASIEGGDNKSSRALILKGLAVGKSTIVVTDGVVDKTVVVTVEAPESMSVSKKGGVELTANGTYELGEFTIKGGTGNFKVEAINNSDKVKEIATPTQSWDKKGYNFTIERNENVAEGGEVTIKVTNLDKPTETFTFKVNCETLLKFDFKIGGTSIPKSDNDTGAHYSISSGMFAGYILRNIKVGETIEVTVSNGTAPYTVTVGNSSKIEVTETADNDENFKIKAVESGNYYGSITVEDSNGKQLKITRIYID